MINERQAVVLEAQSWLRTPFGHRQSMKGVETDCAGLIKGVFGGLRLIPPIVLPDYTSNWFESDEKSPYQELLNAHWIEVSLPEPGDVVTFKWGVCSIAHVGIVVAWPTIVFACSWDARRGVELGDGEKAPFVHRRSGYWSLKRWHLDG